MDEQLVDKTIDLLENAKAGGLFNEMGIAHLQKDTDFDGIRTHPKFVAFVDDLQKK